MSVWFWARCVYSQKRVRKAQELHPLWFTPFLSRTFTLHPLQLFILSKKKSSLLCSQLSLLSHKHSAPNSILSGSPFLCSLSPRFLPLNKYPQTHNSPWFILNHHHGKMVVSFATCPCSPLLWKPSPTPTCCHMLTSPLTAARALQKKLHHLAKANGSKRMVFQIGVLFFIFIFFFFRIENGF